MAIVKNSGFRDSRLEDGSFSPSASGDSVSSDGDEEVQTESTSTESNGSDMSEVDSGMESDDDCDYSELGEAGSEFCQVGNQSCMIPYELYDLPDLSSILSVDTWNNCLTEDERFALAEYLPDMDQEAFIRTMKELFAGEIFHFGSPLTKIFNMLKGGLCEPRVVLYRQGLNYLQKRDRYHHLRKYQNTMVGSFVRIRDVWANCAGYGIEERLRMLKMLRSQRPSKYEEDGDIGMETDSGDEENGELYWRKRLKMGRRDFYQPKSSFDVLSRGSDVLLESTKFEKENPKGKLKIAPSKVAKKKGYIGATGKVNPPVQHAPGIKGRSLTPANALAQHDRSLGSDFRAKWRIKNRPREYSYDVDMDDHDYEIGAQHGPRAKPGKKHEFQKRRQQDFPAGFDKKESQDYLKIHSSGGKKNASLGVTVASYDPLALKRSRHLETNWSDSANGKGQHLDPSAGRPHSRLGKSRKEIPPVHFPVEYSHSYSKGKKWEVGLDTKLKSKKHAPVQTGNSHFHFDDHLSNDDVDNFRSSSQNRGIQGHLAYPRSDETESDSSGHIEEEAENTPLSRKLGYPDAGLKNHQHGIVRSHDPKQTKKLAKKSKNEHAQIFDSEKLSKVPEADLYPPKGRHKCKTGLTNYSHSYATETASPSGKLADNQKQISKMMKKDQVRDHISRGRIMPSQKTGSTDRKRKGRDPDYSLAQPDYMHDYASDVLVEEEMDVDGTPDITDGPIQAYTTRSMDQVDEANHEELSMPLVGCKSVMRKRKVKGDVMHLDGPDEPEDLQAKPDKLIDDAVPSKKKGKRKADAITGSQPAISPDPIIIASQPTEVEPEPRPTRKPFMLITPTVHTGFSFSIVHLLSAVRKAMITMNPEDATELENQKREENGISACHTLENSDAGISEEQKNMPSLTVQEIVNRVKSNPGDPCILETQEPLQDLVRGVLKIFSSKTAPLGAKGWKALVVYEKSSKSWSWTGPVLPSSSDPVEEETSAEAWDIPHKMLVKLVDAFANWLKSGQETLKQIGSLPPPPIMVLPNADEKERFRDLRAQKSLITISPSSDEVKAYFRKEEYLRYQVPDRAFSYTAADGKKSIVAPLRRGGGKPTSKARDHFMLKPDRPPHVTILCLVRDAAARLPGSIGTRADVCILIRDSQYVMEDVSDVQVNQVVSGALDRLHYERDPCVQYDNERKLWVYLHRDREEEDFEDDGTSSTKKWKKPRKDASENPEMGATEANENRNEDQVAGGSTGFDFNSDPNVEPPSIHVGEKPELLYNDLGLSGGNAEPVIDSMQGTAEGHPIGWEVLGFNRLHENRMLCQENSTNEDFDDETFGRERPVGILNTSLL